MIISVLIKTGLVGPVHQLCLLINPVLLTMHSHLCNCVDALLTMHSHLCNCVDALLTMHSHLCNCADALLTMHSHLCNCVDALLTMHAHLCNCVDALLTTFVILFSGILIFLSLLYSVLVVFHVEIPYWNLSSCNFFCLC